jgi:hypothetical protein
MDPDGRVVGVTFVREGIGLRGPRDEQRVHHPQRRRSRTQP